MGTIVISESLWYMAPILVSMVVTITGAINGKFGITKGIWPQVVSWVVSAILSVGSWFLGFVTVGTPVWLGVIILSVVVGLCSNGIYDIPTIKGIIDKLFPVKGSLNKPLGEWP